MRLKTGMSIASKIPIAGGGPDGSPITSYWPIGRENLAA
jgi:hypothetical protein